MVPKATCSHSDNHFFLVMNVRQSSSQLPQEQKKKGEKKKNFYFFPYSGVQNFITVLQK